MNKFRKKKDVVWDVAISRRALDDTRPHPLTKVPLRRRIYRFSMGSLGHQHPKIYRHIFYATKETERRENISLLPIQHLELTREPIESDIKFTVRIPAKALVATSPNEFSVVHHLRHVENYSFSSFMEHIQTLGLQVAPFDEKQKNGLPLVTLESKTPSALGKRDSAIARIGPIPMKLPLVPPPVPYSPQSTISSGSSCDGGGGEEKRKRKSVPFKMVGGVPVKKRRFQYRYH